MTVSNLERVIVILAHEVRLHECAVLEEPQTESARERLLRHDELIACKTLTTYLTNDI